MPTPFVIVRVSSLPGEPDPNTMYIVKDPVTDIVTMTFTGNDSVNIGHTLSTLEVEAIVQDAMDRASSVFVLDTIADMTALTPVANAFAYVKDTSGDPLAVTPTAGYIWDVSENLWLPLPAGSGGSGSVGWSSITDGPVSSVAELDDAVAKRHAHTNLAQLEKISEDGDGKITYDGRSVSAVEFASTW